MSYLVYDESGELLDVLAFESPEELQSYKKLNPQFLVEEVEVDNLSDLSDEMNEDYDEDNEVYEDDLW